MKITPSQQKRIDSVNENPDMKLLNVSEHIWGIWLVIEKLSVRRTKKHEPPFRYTEKLIGKRGATLIRRSGNICDGEMIIDNFTEVRNSHIFGYKV